MCVCAYVVDVHLVVGGGREGGNTRWNIGIIFLVYRFAHEVLVGPVVVVVQKLVNVLCIRGYREERKNAEEADRNLQTGSHHFGAVVAGHGILLWGSGISVPSRNALCRNPLSSHMRAPGRPRMWVEFAG